MLQARGDADLAEEALGAEHRAQLGIQDLERHIALVLEVAREIHRRHTAGANLVAFTECFVPGYPLWIWHVPAGATHELRALYGELVEQSVTVPSDATNRLARAARSAGVTIAIGVNERNDEASGASLFNS